MTLQEMLRQRGATLDRRSADRLDSLERLLREISTATHAVRFPISAGFPRLRNTIRRIDKMLGDA